MVFTSWCCSDLQKAHGPSGPTLCIAGEACVQIVCTDLCWFLCVVMYTSAARAKGKYLLGTMWPAEQADVPVRPIHHKQKTQTQPLLLIFQTVSSREPDHCRIQITVTQREPRWLIDPQLDCQSTDAQEQHMKGQWEVLQRKISYSYGSRHLISRAPRHRFKKSARGDM